MSNARLFEPWPDDRLEPDGNPAYEGTGYPAAGYGQTVRQLVPLPGGYGMNPQLAPWEDPAPYGQRVYPRGSIVELQSTYGQPVGAFGALTFEEAWSARLAQGRKALAEADAVFAAMKARVDNPPYMMNAETLGAWRRLVIETQVLLEQQRRNLADRVLDDITFSKWLNTVQVVGENAAFISKEISTQGLVNALKYTFIESAKTVGEGVVKVGDTALKTGSWLSNPWVIAGLIIGAGAIYIFAKSGGSIVRVSHDDTFGRRFTPDV